MHARLLLASLFILYSTDFLKAFYQIKWHIKILSRHHNIFCIIFFYHKSLAMLGLHCCCWREWSHRRVARELLKERTNYYSTQQLMQVHCPIFSPLQDLPVCVFVYRELYWLVVSAKSMFYVPFFFLLWWLLTLVVGGMISTLLSHTASL